MGELHAGRCHGRAAWPVTSPLSTGRAINQTTIIASAESFDRASITDVQSGSTHLKSPAPRSIAITGRRRTTVRGRR